MEIRALASSSRTYLGAQLKGWLELLAKTYLQSSLKHRPISAGVLLASARHAPLASDKGYNTHDTLSLVYTAA